MFVTHLKHLSVDQLLTRRQVCAELDLADPVHHVLLGAARKQVLGSVERDQPERMFPLRVIFRDRADRIMDSHGGRGRLVYKKIVALPEEAEQLPTEDGVVVFPRPVLCPSTIARQHLFALQETLNFYGRELDT